MGLGDERADGGYRGAQAERGYPGDEPTPYLRTVDWMRWTREFAQGLKDKFLTPNEYRSNQDSMDRAVAIAQVNATLEVAEQARIANLIEYLKLLDTLPSREDAEQIRRALRISQDGRYSE
jgi:hypothetical protein